MPSFLSSIIFSLCPQLILFFFHPLFFWLPPIYFFSSHHLFLLSLLVFSLIQPFEFILDDFAPPSSPYLSLPSKSLPSLFSLLPSASFLQPLPFLLPSFADPIQLFLPSVFSFQQPSVPCPISDTLQEKLNSLPFCLQLDRKSVV